MEISENDTPQERGKFFYFNSKNVIVELKLKVLKLYDYKLAERELRKKFAIERNIIDFKKLQVNML
jgi:hypothetical protein